MKRMKNKDTKEWYKELVDHLDHAVHDVGCVLNNTEKADYAAYLMFNYRRRGLDKFNNLSKDPSKRCVELEMTWFDLLRVELERGIKEIPLHFILEEAAELMRMVCTPTRCLLVQDYMWYKRFDDLKNRPEMSYGFDEALFMDLFIGRLEGLHKSINEACAEVKTLKEEVFE